MTFNTWSNSALSTLMRCGEQFRRRYIEREFTPAGVSALTGSAVHVVGAESHKRQMRMRNEWDGDEPRISEEPGTPRSVEEAKDIAASEFDRRLSKDGVMLQPDETQEGKDKVLARGKDSAVIMGAYYVGNVAPVIRPVAVERKITVKPKGMDILILGKTDLVDETPVGEVIIDTKTGKRTPPRGTADRSNQLTMYAMLRGAERRTGPTERVVLNTVVLTPAAKVPSIDRQESRRDSDDVRALVSQLNTAVEMVKKGVFMPNTTGWWCDRRYCAYFETCPYVNARRVSVATP